MLKFGSDSLVFSKMLKMDIFVKTLLSVYCNINEAYQSKKKKVFGLMSCWGCYPKKVKGLKIGANAQGLHEPVPDGALGSWKENQTHAPSLPRSNLQLTITCKWKFSFLKEVSLEKQSPLEGRPHAQKEMASGEWTQRHVWRWFLVLQCHTRDF